MNPQYRRLLEMVPDTARWVETRGALLAGAGQLFGSGGDWILRVDDQRLLSVIGKPGPAQLHEAIEGMEGEWAMVCSEEDGRHWSALLPAWSYEIAVLHELGRPPKSAPAPVSEAHIERVRASSSELLGHLPARLHREIGVVAGRRPLFVAWVENRAVSFCYAAFETETLWDVSVDTLVEFRRLGLAAACAERAIRYLSERGKRPVWGAVESNLASLNLARKLGFLAVDRIAVLELGNPSVT